MSYGEALSKLIDKASLALVALGASLLILAATGGWPQLTLAVQETVWRITIAAGGSALLVFGAWMAWRDQDRKLEERMPGDEGNSWGIRIVSPRNGYVVDGPRNLEISGTFQHKPRDSDVRIFNASPDLSHWWPQVGCLQYDVLKKTWGGSTFVQSDTYVVVMTVGPQGRLLCQYFEKCGRETGSWPSLERLPEDIVECDRVWVRYTTPAAAIQ